VSADAAAVRDRFAAAEGGSLGHAGAWGRIIREAYGLEPHYLESRTAEGRLEGILPLVRFRGLTGRLELVSMPFLDTGGILARGPDAARALLEAAFAFSREIGASAIELRQLERGSDAGGAHRVDLVLDLEDSETAQWSALGAKVRNQTRKAEKSGLCIASGPRAAQLAGFYGPFRVNMRDLGSPVHSERFFAAMADAFGDRVRFIVTRRDAPVGGLAAIRYAGAVHVPWASTLRSERASCPNNQIYWEAIRWAIAGGERVFDFGRSPIGSGTHRFKLGWGARERGLRWERFDSEGRELALAPAADSAVLQPLTKVWSRLPLALASRLGPAIRCRISS